MGPWRTFLSSVNPQLVELSPPVFQLSASRFERLFVACSGPLLLQWSCTLILLSVLLPKLQLYIDVL